MIDTDYAKIKLALHTMVIHILNNMRQDCYFQ